MGESYNGMGESYNDSFYTLALIITQYVSIKATSAAALYVRECQSSVSMTRSEHSSASEPSQRVELICGQQGVRMEMCSRVLTLTKFG